MMPLSLVLGIAAVVCTTAAGFSESTPPRAAPSACEAPAGAAAEGVTLFVEWLPPAVADTVVDVHICLTAPPSLHVGSFHLRMAYDTGAQRAVAVEPAAGLQAHNTTRPGMVDLAGAAPGGFEPGLLAVVRMTLVTRGVEHPGTLSIVELNGVGGEDLLGLARVAHVVRLVRAGGTGL
jgi:hypothetical protein